MTIRERIYEITEFSLNREANSRICNVYNYVMTDAIIASLIPLAFKQTNILFHIVEIIALALFIIDYILRLSVADLRLKKGRSSFWRYPLTPMAIMDLISIFGSFSFLNSTFKVFRIIRLIRLCRTLRIFRLLRYSKNLMTVINVIKKQKDALITVFSLAGLYIVFTALILFNIEPSTFSSFFDAIYWATISLTTVGYGDIYPVSTAGRIVAMISAIVGIAVVALPAGIITAGYMSEIHKNYTDEKSETGLNLPD